MATDEEGTFTTLDLHLNILFRRERLPSKISSVSIKFPLNKEISFCKHMVESGSNPGKGGLGV